MGRKSKRSGAIPKLRLRKRGGKTYYFYDHGGKPRREEPLGCDYGLAVKRWAELQHEQMLPPGAEITFAFVAEQYRQKVIPTKALRTQSDNQKELNKLLEFFNDPPGPLDAIKPKMVKQYLNWRRPTLIRATREKALLSHLWNWARGEGYTDLENPCAGISGATSKGRDAYIEDDEYVAIWAAASPVLRDAMDLAYLTGQRPADVLKMDESDLSDDVVRFKQGKTRTKVRVERAGSIPEVLARIRARKAGHKIVTSRLVVNEFGRPIGVNAMSRHWKAACIRAGIEGLQFRDLRAKAATDTEEETGNIRKAQKQLGHSRVTTTEGYVRNRRGAKVAPTKDLRKLRQDAEKTNPPKRALNMEAEVGIEPAYADLQSEDETSGTKV